jgi:3-oxoacyl-[acyl-carrier-protein] synthase II
MSDRRVVITGVGMVTPLGNTCAATIRALEAGARAVAPATAFDARGFAESLAAEVRGFDAREYFRIPKALKLADRPARFAVAAAVMALADAAWAPAEAELEQVGVILGSSGSDLRAGDLASAIGPDPELRSVHDIPYFAGRMLSGLNPLWLLMVLPNMASAHVAIQLGVRGPNSTVMTDWIAGIQAIGEATGWIRNGEAEVVLAGGADTAVTPFAFADYEQGGVLRPRTSSPSQCPGFIPGEGAAVLVLEEREHALRRGASWRADVCAYATASPARTAPTGREDNALARTIEAVLFETGWSPADVDTVATASVFAPPFDAVEDAALSSALGPRVHSIRKVEVKSRLGHALAASGAIDVGLLLGSRPSEATGRRLLCNSLGFSGQAACLALYAGAKDARDGGRS